MLFRLKNSPRRARNQAIAALAHWLDAIAIDPRSPCRGISAVEILFGRLFAEFGNTACSVATGNHLHVGSEHSISPEEARSYIWGVTQEIIEVEDEEAEEDEVE